MSSKKTPLNQRRKPKQTRSVAKYNAVLEACTQVLATYGYKKTTIMELSLESGVAVPTIYQYFPDKESIFIAWLDNAVDKILAEVVQPPSNSDELNLENFIYGILQQALPAIEFYREGIRNLFADLPHILVSRTLKTVRDKTTATVSTVVSHYLDGEVSELLNARLQVMMQCILGFILQRVLIEDSEPLDQEASEQLTLLVLSFFSAPAVTLS